MRIALTAAASCLGLLLWTAQPAASQSAASVAEDTAAGNQSDAADKHAKRTACLKDAKTKKLVGAHKTAFLKDCMSADAPKPLTSARSAAPG
jgi:hypothetical protein